MQGIVIVIFPSKGYGFIRGMKDGKTRFFHATSVKPKRDFDLIHEGQLVEFDDMDTGAKGLRATWVRRVNDAA